MEWQNTRMRRALKNYRLKKSIGTRKPTWEEVTADIEISPENVPFYTAPGAESFEGEALRRFAEAKQGISLHRWNHVKNFLIAEKLLTEDDFHIEATELRDLFVVAESLANESLPAAGRVSAVSGTHKAYRYVGPMREEISWEVVPEPEIFAFVVRENFVIRIVPSLETAGDMSSGTIVARGVRRGYGFASTALNLLHIFVRGHDAEDRITYVEMETDGESPSKISLLRHGARLPVFAPSNRPTLSDNVIKFTATGEMA